MLKTALVFLVIAAACVAGNPVAGEREWRWKARLPTMSPNIKGLPFKEVIDSYTPSVRIPGTKTVEGCGQGKPQSRIAGGAEVIPHSLPWAVALYIDDMFVCGGAIISEEWVLTSAYCIDNAEVVVVIAGAHNIKKFEETQELIQSIHFFMHEQYGPHLMRHNIALVKMPKPLTWTDSIAPICLPSRSDGQLAPGTIVSTSGWGLPLDSDLISDILREVSVPVIDTAECRAFYHGVISDSVVCTDSSGGNGICYGDTGDPMNYVVEGVTYIRGVASFLSAAGCGTGDPDGFTRVIDYLDWIETNTGIAINE